MQLHVNTLASASRTLELLQPTSPVKIIERTRTSKDRLKNHICPCCMAGRQHHERFPRKSENRSSHFGERIYLDLMGPMPQISLGGSKYVLVFADDYSRKGWVYFLKNKSETITKFCEFKKKIEGETRNRIQALRIDRGREYLLEEFSTLCRTAGIRREIIQAHTPQQNDVSERRNRTIMERARSMSSDCNLPINLWTEAVSHA